MMFKTLFFILALSLPASVFAKVTARWLTVSSVLFDDGKTKILFDPAWTRPSLFHWLGWDNLRSDQKLVEAVLRKHDALSTAAVFASHSHFDHVIDAPAAAKLTGGIFYTDESSERIAEAYKDPSLKTQRIIPGEIIKIGDFIVRPLLRQHPRILHLFEFLPGDVPVKTELNFWDYHVGSTWFYLIEHPEGTILLDQGCESQLETVSKYTKKIDALLQGVANRRTDDQILEGYARMFRPSIYVPLHFDNFFADFNDGVASDLPLVNLETILAKLKKAFPKMTTERPQYGKEIVLLEIQGKLR